MAQKLAAKIDLTQENKAVLYIDDRQQQDVLDHVKRKNRNAEDQQNPVRITKPHMVDHRSDRRHPDHGIRVDRELQQRKDQRDAEGVQCGAKYHKYENPTKLKFGFSVEKGQKLAEIVGHETGRFLLEILFPGQNAPQP